jgi:hypothetical protein
MILKNPEQILVKTIKKKEGAKANKNKEAELKNKLIASTSLVLTLLNKGIAINEPI